MNNKLRQLKSYKGFDIFKRKALWDEKEIDYVICAGDSIIEDGFTSLGHCKKFIDDYTKNY